MIVFESWHHVECGSNERDMVGLDVDCLCSPQSPVPYEVTGPIPEWGGSSVVACGFGCAHKGVSSGLAVMRW